MPSSPAPGDGAARVLLIDDTEAIRQLLRILFELEPGLEILEAEDGEAGLDAARRHRPHVVVLDWQMPRLDGIDTAKRLRAELPDTRIVMYSSRLAGDAAATALAAGADEYLEKGTDIAVVVAAVRRHLAR